MSKTSNDDEQDALSSFGISKSAFESIPRILKTFATTSLILALLAFSIGVVLASILLVRLGFDALFTQDRGYQESAKNFLFVLAGAFAAPFLVWRAWVAHIQANAATAQAKVALESHLTGIFAKSIELLGAVRDVTIPNQDGTLITRSLPNLESRLGALYALERLLRESAKDQQAILETLCAYVRENSPLEESKGEEPDAQTSPNNTSIASRCRNDVQAALTVIGRRSLFVQGRGKQEQWSLDLRNTNLSDFDLSGLNFDKSNFSGSLLIRAKLVGSSLQNSTFLKTKFSEADLTYATFSQSSIDRCDFKKAKILETDLSLTTIEDSDIRAAKVVSFNIEGANLEKAFGSWLDYLVEDAIKNGPNSLNAMEIIATVEFFKKAKHDKLTSVSTSVVQAISLMSENSKHIAEPDNCIKAD